MTEAEHEWVASHFDRCAPFIQAALDKDIGTHDLNDVRDLVLSETAQLWPKENSAAVTILEFYPRKTLFRIWLAGGNLEELVALEPRLRAWAEKAGADCIFIGGRDGWVRALDGYRKVSVSMVRHLT